LFYIQIPKKKTFPTLYSGGPLRNRGAKSDLACQKALLNFSKPKAPFGKCGENDKSHKMASHFLKKKLLLFYLEIVFRGKSKKPILKGYSDKKKQLLGSWKNTS